MVSTDSESISHKFLVSTKASLLGQVLRAHVPNTEEMAYASSSGAPTTAHHADGGNRQTDNQRRFLKQLTGCEYTLWTRKEREIYVKFVDLVTVQRLCKTVPLFLVKVLILPTGSSNAS